MPERARRVPSDQPAEPGRYVYAAGVIALTEPGPAAAGIVVTDQHGRAVAHRAHYVGQATRARATAEALLAGMRLAQTSGLEQPVFRLDDASLVSALKDGRPLPRGVAPLGTALREAAEQLPGHRLEVVGAAANPARAVALAPLVDWLPERARRSEDLRVRQVGPDRYEVESASQPGSVYRISLRPTDGPGGAEPLQCQCPDFEYRGIPCKHILAVAREAGILERVFYPEPVEPAGRPAAERT